MNRLETWFCGTAFWLRTTEQTILPWMLRGYELGESVLELGAGPGATTNALSQLAARVTALEYDKNFAGRLRGRFEPTRVEVVQGDAAELPFADRTFSSVVTMFMLHHLKSPGAQEECFKEVFRVLQPGGAFVALELANGWLQRFVHIKSTFVPIAPEKIASRLESLGFANAGVAKKSAAFRVAAIRGPGA